jgi:hypothetical protein
MHHGSPPKHHTCSQASLGRHRRSASAPISVVNSAAVALPSTSLARRVSAVSRAAPGVAAPRSAASPSAAAASAGGDSSGTCVGTAAIQASTQPAGGPGRGSKRRGRAHSAWHSASAEQEGSSGCRWARMA